MSQGGKFYEGTIKPDLELLTGNVGGSIGVDSTYNINLLGGANITTTGTPLTNTITFDVTGTTDHTLQIGNATGSLTSIAVGLTGTIVTGVTGADPVWTTATYPATAAIGDVIYGSALNTITGLAFDATATRYLANTGTGATLPEWNQVNLVNGVKGILPVINGGTGVVTFADGGVLVGSGANPITVLALGSAGQVLTSNGAGADPSFQASRGLTWTLTTVDASIVAENGYIANKAGLLTMTLPATATVGDSFAIVNINTAAGWKIAQNASGYIRFGNQVTTVGAGGSLAAVALGDSIECVCIETDDGWLVRSSQGNITIV